MNARHPAPDAGTVRWSDAEADTAAHAPVASLTATTPAAEPTAQTAAPPAAPEAPPADVSIDLRFELNGQWVQHRCAPTRRLLGLLRDEFGLVGAKPGCEVGRCGACMVWLNDAPANACLVMAWQLQGQRVTTIEALAADPASAPVREALAQCGGLQCGYCTAGFVMTLTHLHQQQPKPSVSEAADLACGNLCRCTGYGGVQRAIERLF